MSTSLQLDKTQGGAVSREKKKRIRITMEEKHANFLLEHARKWMHTCALTV